MKKKVAGSSKQEPRSRAGEATTGYGTVAEGQALPSRTMFSAASFFDVIDAGSRAASLKLEEETGERRQPFVAAFYGFRGGAGRTMALAHVAALLADRGRKITAIDLDVEAPGLHEVFGAALPPDRDIGSVALLRRAVTEDPQRPLRAADHLLNVPTRSGSGRILLLPAGSVSTTYLARIEELGTALWHAREHAHPLARIIEELHEVDRADAYLVDCRTGFDGLSASVLFHVSDLICMFTPLSPQIWGGVEVFMKALGAARKQRAGLPALLLVPTMVPLGEAGRLLQEQSAERFRQLYGEHVGDPSGGEESDDPDVAPADWLCEGIPYSVGVATSGRALNALSPSMEALYAPMARRLSESLGGGVLATSGIEVVDAAKVLREMKVEAGSAFAEENEIEGIEKHFVAPAVLETALDRSTALIVGAKGAGKTFLWRYLVHGSERHQAGPRGMNYAVGHGPRSPEKGNLQLTPDALKELETQAQMKKQETHKAFWLFYSLARIACRGAPETAFRDAAAGAVQTIGQGGEKVALRRLINATDASTLKSALVKLLLLPSAGTLAETVVQAADRCLTEGRHEVTLLFDGLDTGFEVGGQRTEWEARQDRFVSSLLQVILDARSGLRRIFFKVFLREDIYLSVGVQNKSHLDPAKVELRWCTSDIWKMALGIVTTSTTYTQMIEQIRPGIRQPWPADEETLEALLVPLWGETVEKGKLARSANYVRKRTSDAAERLFPRTLVQVIKHAVEEERRQQPGSNPSRVIRFRSLQKGVAKASAQRLEDLEQEYRELAPYLKALAGSDITGTVDDFIKHLKRNMQKSTGGRRVSGAKKGALHAGPGGWKKVIDRLQQVGVLGPYRRRSIEEDNALLAVALLYREGLRTRRAGLT